MVVLQPLDRWPGAAHFVPCRFLIVETLLMAGPDGLFYEAMLGAESLRARNAGPRHLLLVLLEGPADDPARRALEAAGLTAERVRGVNGRSRRRGASGSPALMQVDAFARGLAVGRGDRQASRTDELLALCWYPDYWLDDRDLRRSILRHLQAAGIAVPPGRLPKWDPTRFTQRIEIDRVGLNAAITLLKQRHPVGTHPRWGFNYRPRGRAELFAEDGIDLAVIAADSVAQ